MAYGAAPGPAYTGIEPGCGACGGGGTITIGDGSDGVGGSTTGSKSSPPPGRSGNATATSVWMSSCGTVGRSSTGPDGAASMRDGTMARMLGTGVGTVGTASKAPGTAAGPEVALNACAASLITGDGSVVPRVGWVGPVSLPSAGRGFGTGTLSVGTPIGVPVATTMPGLDAAGIAAGGGGALGALDPAGAGTGAARVGMPMSVFCISRLGRSGAGTATAMTAVGGRLSRMVGGADSRLPPGNRTVLPRSGTVGRDTGPLTAIVSSVQVASMASARAPEGVPAWAPSGTRWRGTGGGDSEARCSTMWARRPLPRGSRRTKRNPRRPGDDVTTASPSSTAAFDARASTTRTWVPPLGPAPVTGMPSSPSAVASARKTRTTSSTVVQRLTRRHAVPSATGFECRQFRRV